MPNTTNYNFGDVVLVPFPFTDQTTIKKRPAVVVSSDAYNKSKADVILMANSYDPPIVTLGRVVARRPRQLTSNPPPQPVVQRIIQ